MSLEFRSARNAALEKAGIHLRENRIFCPAVDSGRIDSAYGKKPMPETTNEGVSKWALALGIPEESMGKVLRITHMSGPWWKFMSNQRNGCFDETELNTGQVKYMKHGIHTGITGSGKFDQEVFNGFIWNLFPDLKGTAIDNTFLTNDNKADRLYLTTEHLDKMLEWNYAQSDSWFTGLGLKLSRFEMEKLMLGILGQSVANPQVEEKDTEENKAISLRDVHDLFKYGIYPAPIEDKMLESGLIEKESIAMSG